MKIIHTADLHIDSKMNTHLEGDKAALRKLEINNAFSRLIEFASLHDVEIILIAGDMFDNKLLKKKTIDYILGLIRGHQDINFVYLPGNHEEDAFIKNMETKPSNLFVFDDRFKSFEFHNVRISGVILNKETKEYLKNDLVMLNDKFNILTLHGQINSTLTEGIDLNRLSDKNIDYLALGHVHEYQTGKLGLKGIYAYSGCLEGRGFDEIGDKGFILLDIKEDNSFTYEFIKSSKRVLHHINQDITGLISWNEVEKLIDEKIKLISKDDLIKITLTGKYDEVFIKQNEMFETKLNTKYFYVKIKDESTLKIDMDLLEKEISLRSEFIKQVSFSNLNEDEKQRILEYGLKALLGEDL